MTVQLETTDKLSPIERLEALCDRGSLTLLRSDVRSRRMGRSRAPATASSPAPGASTAAPSSATRRTRPTSGLARRAARRLDRARAAARRPRRRAGRRLHRVRRRAHAGGPGALAGYACIFQEHVRLSGKIPQISVICGASAGGGSLPALTDFVVMTQRGNMFLTGPAVVRDVMGEDVDAADLGGYKVHEKNGVAHFIANDDLRRRAARARPDRPPAQPGERARPALALLRPRRLRRRRPGPGGRAQGLRRARRDPRDRRRRADARVRRALGAQHRDRLRPPRRPASA